MFGIIAEFILRLFKTIINQMAPGLNRALSSKFLVAEKYKPPQFYRRTFFFLSKTKFTNELNMELKKQSIEWKHTDSLKEKILEIVVSKEGLLGHEKNHHLIFYCQLLNQNSSY